MFHSATYVTVSVTVATGAGLHPVKLYQGLPVTVGAAGVVLP